MSSYSPTDLEALVRQRAPEIAKEISHAAISARNEADLVAQVERVIERFAKNFDVSLNLDRERTLINGRADAVYNRFVIEYEPAGSLRLKSSHGHNQHAIGQVKQYMEGLERVDRHKKDRLAGVVLDGHFYIFVRYRNDHWYVDDPVPVSGHSTETFLRYLLSLSTELALTPENLVRDFGENSNTARNVVPVLYNALVSTKNPKVAVLFKQWQRQFREVSGYDPQSGQLDAAALTKSYAVIDTKPDLERLFFTIHTYYASFIKLLALQVAYYYLMPKLGTGLAAAASYQSDKLRDYLLDMERGGLFAQLGIRNFLEGDFFGWHLEIWDDEIDGAMRRLIGDLANYSLVTLDVDPEETRDLLKQLYQNLMPKKLRHALGEYYTPDWLAERLLNQLGYEGDPKKRLLDPACGSGTFLVLAIKRVRQYAEEKMLRQDTVLGQVLENIVGFDLNPLAVISARTNYLLALGDLLQSRRGDISIPVYIADSILTPSMEVSAGGQMSFIDLKSQEDGKVKRTGYTFNTAVGRFTVPGSLVDARYIDQLSLLLEESVQSELAPAQFKARLLKTFPLDEGKEEDGVEIAMALYEQLLELERQQIDGIWARIIKNAFAPLFQGRFDYIAGNPPWVNWESLPGDYRQETKPLWVHHGLFPHGGMDTILGKGKKDISMLMTYVAMDNYLGETGRLGFIITQSVLKTAGAGQGFRRFVLGSNTPFGVVAVDDLVDLQPFEGASNRTAVMILQRGRPTRYPVPYSSWHQSAVGRRIRETATLAEAISMSTVKRLVAVPVNGTDITSPWITGSAKALQAVQKVLGPSSYQAHEGANSGGANSIFWLEIISIAPNGSVLVSNFRERAKVKVDSVQAVVETQLLFPLLRGRDIKRWTAQPEIHLLVVQDPKRRRGFAEDLLSIDSPKTFAYLKHFETVLRQRSAYRRYFRPDDPFYSMFGVGTYTFAPYKVVWARVAEDIKGAVVSSAQMLGERKPVVPVETVTFVPFNDEVEAHYFCSVLNSRPWRFVVNSSSVPGTGGFGSPNVLGKARIDTFDSDRAEHCRLAILSQQAHEATAGGDTGRVKEIEAEIDRLAAQLWGLTDAELKEIQESLAELG